MVGHAVIDVVTLLLILAAFVAGYAVGITWRNGHDHSPEIERRLADLERQHAQTVRLAEQQSTIVCDMATCVSTLGELRKDHERRLKAVEGRAWLN